MQFFLVSTASATGMLEGTPPCWKVELVICNLFLHCCTSCILK